MGVELVVETRTLSELSVQLRTIKDGLDGIENMVEGYDEATGSASSTWVASTDAPRARPPGSGPACPS